MDIIEMTRELCRELQKDERFITLQMVQQKADADAELQALIGDFNIKRMAIQNEAAKENRSDEKLQQLNTELRQCYATVMQNPNMIAYNEAKDAMDALIQRINAIITQSAEGGDPDTADYDPSSCGGDCGSCAGCH